MASSAANVENENAALQEVAVAARRFKKRIGTTRERTGCLTCRQRRKKCVENTYPICGHCRRLNLECIRESPRTLVVASNASQAHVPEPFDVPKIVQPHVASPRYAVLTIPDAMTLGQYVGLEASGDRRYWLKYYTQVLSTMLTTNHENNSFLSVFLPMAFESPPLLSTIIAWSTAHLSCFQPSYGILALEKQSLALRSVSAALSAPTHPPIQETNLAACLCLCTTEVAMGDTSQWYHHLTGAKHIIMSATKMGPGGEMLHGPEALMHTLDGEWLLRNFAYHDILSSVTLDEPPLIQGSYWLQDGVEVVDAYIGTASRILAIISEIMCMPLPIPFLSSASTSTSTSTSTSLASTSTTTPSQASCSPQPKTPTDDETDLWLTFVSLEYRLQSWTPPPAPQVGLTAMALAYRSAALLLLYRKMRTISRPPHAAFHFPDVQAKIATQVRAVLRHLGEIPAGSLPECGSLFPLFLAGGETRSPDEIEDVRGRMAELLGWRGFANIRRASEVLEELWRLRFSGIRGAEGDEVDWRDVVGGRGERLMLS